MEILITVSGFNVYLWLHIEYGQMFLDVCAMLSSCLQSIRMSARKEGVILS
ncbi:MAG: hypothetical protein J6S84_10290 [Bacteroidales bacterium]|nr:hypothetical protein [Bacteroidales bacterium]